MTKLNDNQTYITFYIIATKLKEGIDIRRWGVMYWEIKT